MHKKYTIPLSIFIVFEHISVALWTSESFKPNNYIIFLKKNWLYSVNIFLKKEVFLSSVSLIEHSGVDFKKKLSTCKYEKIDFFSKNETILIYIYFFFLIKTRVIFFTSYNNTGNIKICSLDRIFKSANWLERETSEMFKVVFKNKVDRRRLLLDYSRQENPLLKSFPSEGYNDVFFSLFENQVIYDKNIITEL